MELQKNRDDNNENTSNNGVVLFPHGRHEACFVRIGNKAYLLGGRGKRLPINELDLDFSGPFKDNYDSNGNNRNNPLRQKWPGRWTRKSARLKTQDVHHAQCLEYQDKIWIVSSWTGGYPNEKNSDMILIYDPLTDTWNTSRTLNIVLAPERHRGATAAAVYQDEIYISHGASGTLRHVTSMENQRMFHPMKLLRLLFLASKTLGQQQQQHQLTSHSSFAFATFFTCSLYLF